ncbi:MAG: hypothetical protein WC595_01840 [Candidatus Nanoarchaeia archaeon]
MNKKINYFSLVLFTLTILLSSLSYAVGESFETAIPIQFEQDYSFGQEGQTLYYQLPTLNAGEGIEISRPEDSLLELSILDTNREEFLSKQEGSFSEAYFSLSADDSPKNPLYIQASNPGSNSGTFKIKKYTLYDAGIKGDAPFYDISLDNYESAVSLQLGHYANSNPGEISPNARISYSDKGDLYSISVPANKKVVIKVTPDLRGFPSVYLRDQSREIVADEHAGNAGEIITISYNSYEDQKIYFEIITPIGEKTLDYILDIGLEDADPKPTAPLSLEEDSLYAQENQVSSSNKPISQYDTSSSSEKPYSQEDSSSLFSTGIFAFIAGIFVILLVIFLILYIYTALALMSIAKKTSTPNAWLAWIPIGNLYLITQIAQVPAWTLLIFIFGAFIPLLPLVVLAYWWWKIAERLGRPGWYGILAVIFPLNLIFISILAWGKNQTPPPLNRSPPRPPTPPPQPITPSLILFLFGIFVFTGLFAILVKPEITGASIHIDATSSEVSQQASCNYIGISFEEPFGNWIRSEEENKIILSRAEEDEVIILSIVDETGFKASLKKTFSRGGLSYLRSKISSKNDLEIFLEEIQSTVDESKGEFVLIKDEKLETRANSKFFIVNHTVSPYFQMNTLLVNENNKIYSFSSSFSAENSYYGEDLISFIEKISFDCKQP